MLVSLAAGVAVGGGCAWIGSAAVIGTAGLAASAVAAGCAAAGGATADFTSTVLNGGSVEDATNAALDPARRLRDAALGGATAAAPRLLNRLRATNTATRVPRVIDVGDVRLPGVPRGAVGTPVQTGKGLEYAIPRGTAELDPRVVSVRIMDPVTTGKYQYPQGYAVYMNEAGQTVNPLTGQTIGPSDPFAHLPLP